MQRELVVPRFHARVVLCLRHAAQHHVHAERRAPHVLQRARHGVILRAGHVQKLDRWEHARAVIARVGQLLLRLRCPRAHALFIDGAELTARRAEIVLRLAGIWNAVGDKARCGAVFRAARRRGGRAVDGKVKGLANVLVRERVALVVVKDARRRVHRRRLPALVLRELGDHAVGQVGDVVDLARFVELPRLVRVGGEDKVQLVGPDETCLVILVVARRRQLTALRPRAHMVRAVTHKVRRVKASAVLCQIAAQRHRGDRRADALDKIGARRAQRDDKRGFILGRDLELRLVARLAHLVIARHHAHQRVVR